jgi:hypothetical protein
MTLHSTSFSFLFPMCFTLHLDQGLTGYPLFDSPLHRKAAGHELKSLNSLISCNIRSLHFPLMALANYLGYRVIVISKVRSLRGLPSSVHMMLLSVDTHTTRVTSPLPAPDRKRNAQIR